MSGWSSGTFYRSLFWKMMGWWNFLMYTRCPKKQWNSFSEDRGQAFFSLFFQQPSHLQRYFPLWIWISTGEQPRQRKELFRAPEQTVLQNSLCRNQEQSTLFIKTNPSSLFRNTGSRRLARIHPSQQTLLLSVRWTAKNPQHNNDELATTLKQTPPGTGSRYSCDP